MTYLICRDIAVAYECPRRAQRHLDRLLEGGGIGYYISNILPDSVHLARAVMEAK